MESDRKEFSNNPNESSPDEKPSKMTILKPTRSIDGRINDQSLVSMMSRPRKSQRKISGVPRVVFEASPSTNGDDQTPDVMMDEESARQKIDNHRQSSEEITLPELSEEPSEIDSHNSMKDIVTRTKRHLASQAEILPPSTGPPKSDELDSQADRESIRRSTRFLDPAIGEILVQHPVPPTSYRHDERGSLFPTSSEIATRSSSTRPRVSDNIAVQSMLFDVPETECLPPLEATAFAIVLQETLDLLGTLEHVIPARVDERWDESYKTIDEKYGIPDEPRIMFREDMGLLPLIPTVSEKIQRDRTYIYNVLKGTIRDIQCHQRYDRLEIEVDDTARILEGEHNLEINNELWMTQVKQLQDLIDFEKIENEKEVKDLLLSAQRMNAEVDSAIISNTSKLTYVKRWENSRLQQKKLHLQIKEQELNNALEACATMARADEIITREVRTFLEENTRDLEDGIVAWTSRYNEELERVQQDINETKEKIEQEKLDLQNLEELQEERQRFLDKCYEEQELAEKEIAYQAAVNDAATVIQTIWRGYMVRHKLGVYKKLWESFKKKKKKKNAKGKK